MESYLYSGHYDLVTPDGTLTYFQLLSNTEAEGLVQIDEISPVFVGYDIDSSLVVFNIKSTLAQLGLDGVGVEYELDRKNQSAKVKVIFTARSAAAQAILKLLDVGASVGKLFAKDDRRRVRDPDYLSRMFGRSDRWGNPLLSLGGLQGSQDLVLDKIEGRTVAYISLLDGRVEYDDSIFGFLPLMAKALKEGVRIRDLLPLHQIWKEHAIQTIDEEGCLLVKTPPLHIRTVFGYVVDELLPLGFHHATANVMQPDTAASGDIYELYGSSPTELIDIPLEFYTLEPHREYVFFRDRDQLQSCIEDETTLFKAFETSPQIENQRTAVFVVKGEQLLNLKESDWISREPHPHDFPGIAHGTRQQLMVNRYIRQLPSYQFLKAIENGLISSQGILLVRYFPSPMMKRMLLSNNVQNCMKAIYFLHPSSSHQDFFSHEDRALLVDLSKFGIPVFWVDQVSQKVLQYIQRPERDSGMFVPLKEVQSFLKATTFGIYGSNLLEGSFEEDLLKFLEGVLALKEEFEHVLLNKDSSLALVTGGGPGAMEVGNRVAKKLGILSCANIVDFRVHDEYIPVNEQLQNPHVEAKMTYRLDKLVERQAEFHLDFPIFLMGGVGTDFEFSLEEVKRKVGSTDPNPILLFGSEDYWRQKVSHRFQCNLDSGTIRGSEWISNCFYCVQSAEDALHIFRRFFDGTLAIGPTGTCYRDGFATMDTLS
ncbi:hypothetical protein SCG7109_AK_00190 [Chlamydiales bacterium SCGC AG-110-M15]|nr:hypothetical protein SCG7109_AK_00190 [Chlamydiales bacterium SCGC AG-110-M15]